MGSAIDSECQAGEVQGDLAVTAAPAQDQQGETVAASDSGNGDDCVNFAGVAALQPQSTVLFDEEEDEEDDDGGDWAPTWGPRRCAVCGETTRCVCYHDEGAD